MFCYRIMFLSFLVLLSDLGKFVLAPDTKEAYDESGYNAWQDSSKSSMMFVSGDTLLSERFDVVSLV